MKVFWSWQSDTPGKIGRFLIRDAIKDAIEILKQQPDIEEPTERDNREAIHLDHDIQGTTGSPDLVRTILDKIDAAAVVIADVTAVGHCPADTAGNKDSTAGKPLLNSNVAIELGYALKSVTDSRVLVVFNLHFGRHEDLPFDLRHKGGAITFRLSPIATADQIKEQKRALTQTFVNRLKPFLSSSSPSVRKEIIEVPSTFSKAVFFAHSEKLAEIGDPTSPSACAYESDNLCYIRLIPAAPLPKPLPNKLLNEISQRVPVMARQFLTFSSQNPYGFIAVYPTNRPEGRPQGIRASTQLFRTGEIWSTTAELLPPKALVDSENSKALSILPFEQQFYDGLHGLIKFASDEIHFEGPWIIECGAVGISGLNVILPTRNSLGSLYEQEIVHRSIINTIDSTAIDSSLLAFFEEIYDAAGSERSAYLFGFPPNRPGVK